MAADQGHQLTDKKLAELEKRLHDEYQKAAQEIQIKLDDYLRRFSTKDKIWQKWVDKGVRTQEEYEQWRIGQMAMGERWEKMKDRIVSDEMNANRIAREITNQEMPSIFALNANYALYRAEHDAKIDTGMTLYNREAVDRILREDPDLLLPPGKKVSEQIRTKKASRWEKQKIQSVMMQGIIQGEPIPTIAARLSEEVASMDFKAAVRNARTMATNAQNAGRYDAYERLTNNGVDLTLEWAATLDNRTRHEHRMMHGQRRDVGEPFVVDGIEIMYPAQTGTFMGISNVPQELIWNCRCTLLAFVKGFEHDTIKTSDKMGDMTYGEWLEAKENPQDILSQKNKGEAIEQSYIRQYAFPFEPGEGGSPDGGEPVGGGPSDGGWNGPVDGTDITETWQRRPDEFDFEIDDVIDAQGFNGVPRVVSQEEFDEAVKAANGGEGFIAQRIYSAPDADTLKEYQDQLYGGQWYVDCSTGGASLGQGMYAASSNGTKITDDITHEMDAYKEIADHKFGRAMTNEERLDEVSAKIKELGLDNKTENNLIKIVANRSYSIGSFEEAYKAYEETPNADDLLEITNKFVYELDGAKKLPVSIVETFTLDPSAKIGEYGAVRREYREYLKNGGQDVGIGAFAALKGYDAYTAPAEFSGADYTVVLNRTKVIFLRED